MKLTEEQRKQRNAKQSETMKAKYAARKAINPAARIVFNNFVCLNGTGTYGKAK